LVQVASTSTLGQSIRLHRLIRVDRFNSGLREARGDRVCNRLVGARDAWRWSSMLRCSRTAADRLLLRFLVSQWCVSVLARPITRSLADSPIRMHTVRILSLLSGAPNHGIGAVPSESLGRSSVATPKHSGTAKASRDPEEVDLSPATPFYREEASSAGQHGLVFDLLLLAPSSHTHFALPSIKFLSLFTGGRVGIYSCDDTSTLPQDLYVCAAVPSWHNPGLY